MALDNTPGTSRFLSFVEFRRGVTVCPHLCITHVAVKGAGLIPLPLHPWLADNIRRGNAWLTR